MTETSQGTESNKRINLMMLTILETAAEAPGEALPEGIMYAAFLNLPAVTLDEYRRAVRCLADGDLIRVHGDAVTATENGLEVGRMITAQKAAR